MLAGRLRIAPAVFLLFLAAIPTLPFVHTVHAQTSAIVSVNPAAISDFSKTSGSNVSISVDLSGAPALAGFAVQLSFNETVMDVSTLDISNNILAVVGGTVIFECIDEVPIGPPSSVCGLSPPGSIFLGILSGNHTTTAPTNGPLFQAVFGIKNRGVSQLHLSRVLLLTGLPVSIIPVTTVDGYFTNIDCPSGSGNFCTPPIASFSFPSPPLFPGTMIKFNASSSYATNAGASIRYYDWDWGENLPSQITKSAVVYHSYSYPGNYTVTLEVNDTYGITGVSTNTVSVSKSPPQPPPPDFTVRVLNSFPPSTLMRGQSLAFPVQLTSLNGFGGIVNLTADSPMPSYLPSAYHISVSLQTSSLSLAPGATNDTDLVVTAPINATTYLHYVTVTGTSGTMRRSDTFSLYVRQPYFDLTCYPTVPGIPLFGCQDQTLAPGGNTTIPIYVTSLYGFSGNVTLSAESVQGVGIVLSSGSVELGVNQTVPITATISISSQIPPGILPIQIGGRSMSAGPNALLFNINVALPPLPPDFSIQVPTRVDVTAGDNATFQIRVNSLNGLSGLVFADAVVLPQLPGQATVSVVPEELTLASGGANLTQASVKTTDKTPPGHYFVALLIQAGGPRSGLALHSVTIEINVRPPAMPPFLFQLHWKHRVSLSIRGLGGGVQTFVVGVANPNNSTIIYTRVRIQGFDDSGHAFIGVSTVLELLQGQNMVNVEVSEPFSKVDVGHTFEFMVTLEWGLSNLLGSTSDQTTNLNSGAFAVVS